MPLFGLFGKKKETPPSPFEGLKQELAPPLVQRVISLQQQGLSNSQIIEALQREGFALDKIVEALNQAAAPPPAGPIPTEMPQAPPPTPPSELPQAPQPVPAPPAMYPAEYPEYTYPAYPAYPAEEILSRENVEAIAESIVEERWKEATKELTKLSEWKEASTRRLDKLEQSLTDLKADIDNLHKALVAKISEYDKSLIDVGVELKAMEKVFQKVLPSLTESVSELSRITQRVKKAKK
ncbi:MAG: hypothetical protein QXU88_02010 [Candidatus Woesearchaeota archaeon]